MYGIIFSIVLSVGIGCANRGKVMHNLPINSFVISNAPTVTFSPKKQDTVQKKTVSAAEIQALMSNAYRFNYDKFFKPEFSRLNDVISAQAKSITTLSHTIDSVRGRSIKRNERQEREIAKYQKLYSDLLRKQIKSAELQTESNNRQIAQTNKVVKYLIIGWVILFVGFATVAISNFIMNKRIKQLQKSLNYA